MIRQVLSIEQMRHLKELCVDTSGASMFYVPKLEPKDEYCLLNVKPNPVIPYIPAFTLKDIIELLPKRLDTKDKKEGELLMFYDSYMKTGWNVRYTDYFDIIQDSNLIDALYKLLCWCAENGHLTTNK